jgi:hypothetical protein
MKLFAIILTAIGTSSICYAHCPLNLMSNGTTYCTEIDWQPAEQKINGEFLESTTLSPILIAAGTVPPLWLFSKARFSFWKLGDATHTPQEVPGLRIFPYMHMNGGHHHSTAYEFSFDSGTTSYQVKNMAFTEMDGCWSLRWTTESQDDSSASTELLAVTVFTNVAVDQITTCKEGSGQTGQEHNHH